MQNDCEPGAAHEDGWLLTARDVARLLQISVRQVWRWNASGALPRPVRLGGRVVRWRAEELAAWVEAHSRGAGGQERDRAA